jgi:A/G-specific adenine glycosylase
VTRAPKTTEPELPELPELRRRPAFARALAAWYGRGHRDLPWRRTADPYRIWVSEIMLQQTRVETVIPYYQRFVTRFGDAAALAAADLDEVLKLWEGLGYYARARNLHRAAGLVVSDHGGQVPRDLAAVNALPGVGRSTAGSILCFAHGQRHPVLDGNVKRVLLRLYAVAADKTRPPVERWLWRAAETLVADAPDPADHNQALMELGATVCNAGSPTCGDCPVRRWCEARRQGTQHQIPLPRPKRTTPHYTIAVGVIRNEEGDVLVQKRPANGLLGGLWEFPGGKREGREKLTETVRREIAEELDIDVAVGAKITTLGHAYTHFRITLHAYHCTHLSGTPRPRAADAWQWLPVSRLPDLAFPRANQRILELLG